VNDLTTLLRDIRACTHCKDVLPHSPRPVAQASKTAKIIIAGQAPGRKVHESGIPFDDASGDRLRDWMGVSSDMFYNPAKIGIVPMGFCYPGAGKSGDLPPRRECAPLWRQKLLDEMPNVGLTLVVGSYATAWHIPDAKKLSLTETVRNWRAYSEDGIIPLPHPSPRNNIWMAKNAWFAEGVLPELKKMVASLLS